MSGIEPILGEEIARWRRARGLSQAQLADALGVTRTNVSGWENGRTRPTRRHLDALVDVLGVGDEFRASGLLSGPLSLAVVQRRTAAALIRHMETEVGSDGTVIGWRYDLDEPGRPLAALSTAYGVRAVLEAVGADWRINLPAVRTALRSWELPAGGWSPKSTGGRARPEVTAVVLATLRDAGESGDYVARRLDLLVEMLERPDGTPRNRPYVLATSLIELSGLPVDDAVGRNLAERLVSMSIEATDGDRAWPETVRPHRGLGGSPPPSTAHSAMAVCALAAWARRLDDASMSDVAQAGRRWIENHGNLALEDEWFSDWDESRTAVRHFTPAWALRAVVDTGGDVAGRPSGAALRATLSHYNPEASLWRWPRHGGMFPVWMNWLGLAALAAWNGARELG
jgi:transcriptional regulator with XRE-family HTH domain